MKWKHRILNGKSRPEYNSWAGMMGRCFRETHPEFKHYGGRGISVSEAWKNFDTFFLEMNPRPSGTTLDREDVNGDYCKENCKWSNSSDQANNRRSSVFLECKGTRLTVSQWGEKVGIFHKVIRKRIENGWTIEDAIFTPMKKSTRH